MKDRRGLLLLLSVLGAEANILHNGDFQSGSVAPWRCVGCHCDSSDKYLGRTSDFHIELKSPDIFKKTKFSRFLAVRERTASWAGPRQSLESEIFVTEPFLYQLNFSLQADREEEARLGVILHVVRGQEERFMSLFSEEISTSDWTDWSVGVNINNLVVGADSIEIYFEAKPQTVNFNLDNVVLEEWLPGKN